MRILLTIKDFGYGGAQNHVRDLANVLVARGHRVWVAAPPGRQVALLHRSVTHVPLSHSDLTQPLQALQLAWLVRRERIDVIHAHQRLATLTACLAGRLAARPVVATLHGQLQHDLLRWPGAPAMLARLIVVSPYYAALVARRDPVLAAKTVCIPNSARRVGAVARGDDGCVVVACAARVIPRTEAFLTELALAAADLAPAFPAFALDIYGDGPALAALAVSVAEANRGAGRAVVRLSGYHPDLPVALAGADLVVGVGRVAIETLMQGVPLIPANHRYLGPPVTRRRYRALAETNFVPQHCPRPDRAALRRALADGLEQLASLKQEARALQALVERDFDVAAMAGRIEEVYLALALGTRIAGRGRAGQGLEQRAPAQLTVA
jgi:glycosyltransferase involved in cell wall biosynthesis